MNSRGTSMDTSYYYYTQHIIDIYSKYLHQHLFGYTSTTRTHTHTHTHPYIYTYTYTAYISHVVHTCALHRYYSWICSITQIGHAVARARMEHLQMRYCPRWVFDANSQSELSHPPHPASPAPKFPCRLGRGPTTAMMMTFMGPPTLRPSGNPPALQALQALQALLHGEQIDHRYYVPRYLCMYSWTWEAVGAARAVRLSALSGHRLAPARAVRHHHAGGKRQRGNCPWLPHTFPGSYHPWIQCVYLPSVGDLYH